MKMILVSFLIILMSFSSGLATELVITMGGDVNLGASNAKPRVDGSFKYGTFYSWEKMCRHLRPMIDGDLNFLNLETVVSSNGNIKSAGKKYSFMASPSGVEYLVHSGFNLISLANNHSFDYGYKGLEETLFNMEQIKRSYPELEFSGIDNNIDVAKPKIFKIKNLTIAFSAIGIKGTSWYGRFRPTGKKIGMLSIRNGRDYQRVLAELEKSEADIKILSIHEGQEKVVTLDSRYRTREKFNQALNKSGANLIIGHHPHVVRPVGMHGNRAVFYSLGNYLMLGAPNIGKRKLGYDYGLFARVFIEWDRMARKANISAIQIVPLKNMEIHPRPLEFNDAKRKLNFLNKLGKRELGRNSLNFKIRKDGTGVVCLGPIYGPRAKLLCSNLHSAK